MKQGYNAVKETVSPVADSIKSAVKDPVGTAKDTYEATKEKANPIKDTIQDATGKAKDFVNKKIFGNNAGAKQDDKKMGSGKSEEKRGGLKDLKSDSKSSGFDNKPKNYFSIFNRKKMMEAGKKDEQNYHDMDSSTGKEKPRDYREEKGYTGNPLHSNAEDGLKGKFRSGFSPEGFKPTNYQGNPNHEPTVKGGVDKKDSSDDFQGGI